MTLEDFIYIGFGIVGVILIAVTIGLQFMIMDRAGNANDGLIDIEIGTLSATEGIVLAQTPVQPTLLPTITLPPTSTQTSTPDVLPTVLPTATSLAKTNSLVTPTPTSVSVVQTVAQVATVIPTDTALPTSTPSPTPTPSYTPVPPTAILAQSAPADYIFGYIEARPACTLATNIATTLMAQWGWSVRMASLPDARAMFQNVAHAGDATSQLDITLCYIDADDRDLFFEYGISILPIGDGYAESNGKRIAVLAYASVPARMEFEDPCIWGFIKHLDFGDAPLEGTDPLAWIERHQSLVDSWGSCQKGEKS